MLFCKAPATLSRVGRGKHLLALACAVPLLVSTPAFAKTLPITAGTDLKAIQSLTVSPEQYKKSMDGVENSNLDLEGFKKLQAGGKFVVIDVRNKEAFEREHIKGSVNLPLTDMTEKTLPEVAPDKKVPVVVVCDYSLYPTRMMALSMEAYPVLKVNGYEKVFQLNLWQNNKAHTISNPEDYKKDIAFEGTATQPKPEPKWEPAQFTCTPDAFKLTQRPDKTFHLEGTLDTPSSGYSYTYESRPDYYTYDILRLNAPEGTALTVIEPLNISADSKRDFSTTSGVKIEIVKNFNWGPTNITCTRGTAQPVQSHTLLYVTRAATDFKESYEKYREHLRTSRSIKTLNVERFLDAKNDPRVIVIDLNSTDRFNARHVKSSINIPYDKITEEDIQRLAPQKDTPIILLGDNTFFPSKSNDAFVNMRIIGKLGYTNVKYAQFWTQDCPNEETCPHMLDKLEMERH